MFLEDTSKDHNIIGKCVMGRKKIIENKEEYRLSLGAYKKSNRLINAKGKATALQLKVLALSIQRIQVLPDGSMVSQLPGQTLRAALGNYNGSFYTQIKDLCVSTTHANLTSWTTFIEDSDSKGQKRFVARNLISEARFENGNLQLTYNPLCKDDLVGLSRNYSLLQINQMIAMRSPYSIQLYERFKSIMDLERARTGSNGPYFVEYTVDELKENLGLGTIKDSNGRVTQKALFPRWDSFRTKVLEVSKEEINANTCVCMSYDPIRQGVGGKVVAVRFVLRPQKIGETVTERQAVVEAKPKDKPTFNIMEAAQLFGPKFSLQDVLAICDAADNDMDKVRKVCEMASIATGINNKTGWMIAALRGNYEMPPQPQKKTETKSKRKSKKTSNSFTDFEQNEYDFETLEQQLLKK